MKFMLSLLMISMLVACGKKETKSKSSSSSTLKTPKLEVTQVEHIHFNRQRIMTVYLGCRGEIKSQGLETVSSLSKTIKIDDEAKNGASSIFVYNLRGKAFLERDASKGKFKVDYAPHLLRIHVKKGVNPIRYTIYKCVERKLDAQGKEICAKQAVAKKAIIKIHVTYSSEVLPGERIFEASRSECEKPAQNLNLTRD